MDSQYKLLSELLSDQAAFITSPKTSLANYWGGHCPPAPPVSTGLYGGASPVLGTAMRKSNGHIRSGPAAYQTVQARTGGKSAEFCLMVVVEDRASVENMAENWLLNQYDQRIA